MRTLLTALLAAATGLALQCVRFEQSSWNPHTDSCDYVQRTDDGPVQIVCTVVQHVR